MCFLFPFLLLCKEEIKHFCEQRSVFSLPLVEKLTKIFRMVSAAVLDIEEAAEGDSIRGGEIQRRESCEASH